MSQIIDKKEKIIDVSWQQALHWYNNSDPFNALEEQLRSLTSRGLQDHSKSLVSKISELDQEENHKRILKMVRNLAYENGEIIPYEKFQIKLETMIGGFVITAHPTFSMSAEARIYFQNELDNIVCEKDQQCEEVSRLYNSNPISLDEELEQADHAVTKIRRSIRTLNRIAIEATRALYPDDWKTINVSLFTVATWVGFDLDGRQDIGWSTSLRFRYLSALKGLEEIRDGIVSIQNKSDNRYFVRLLENLEILSGCFQSGMEAFFGENAVSLAVLNRLAMENRDKKHEAVHTIDKAFEELLDNIFEENAVIDIASLYSEWRNIGLGLSHIHFRLNAVQLHNAIHSEIQTDIHVSRSPDNSATRRKYLAEINKLLDVVEPVQFHYGSLEKEQTTARRLFMLAAQFEKHFDKKTPIRLLVAESDTPFTLLTTLYYAKLFGMDDHVEISPLFETAVGLHRGDRVIEELLDNHHFMAYIESQGRFCVQLGFSDSGRYIGQPAATLAIERFKLKLIRLWAKRGLNDIDLVFFDTHGEGIGRGAHPSCLRDRFLYTHSHETKKALALNNINYKHEVSFQGGDGYHWFRTDATTLGVLTDFLETRLGVSQHEEDPFYQNSNWSLDFFLSLKEYQDNLIELPGYVKLLDNIAPNLLYPTGSRPSRRQGAGRVNKPLEHIGQVRAIPNNAMLQQLGYMSNVLGGFGTAIHRSQMRFEEMLKKSDRLNRITRLILTAKSRSDVQIMNNYVQLITPDYWINRLEEGENEDISNSTMTLSKIMENTFDYHEMGIVIRRLRREAGLTDEALSNIPMIANFNEEPSRLYYELHKIRLSLIHFIYLKAMLIPRFSSRTDISLEELIARLLALDIPETLTIFREIFPKQEGPDEDEQFGEETTYSPGGTSGYNLEEKEIFGPIEKAYEFILSITTLLALESGAYG